MMLHSLFYTISSLISLYSLACFIRIIMTWIPTLEHSAAGRFISRLCDPYLYWFRRFRFTRVGAIDFSPLLALGLLSVASMTFSTLAASGSITVGIVLAGLVQVMWSIVSFMLNLFILFLIIRLILDLVNKYGYSPFVAAMDRLLNPIIARASRFLFRSRIISYRASLLITLGMAVITRVGFGFGINALHQILVNLPF